MKKLFLYSIPLAGTLCLASCSKDHHNGQTSHRNGEASSVSADTSMNKTNGNNSGGHPTYDASASNKGRNFSSTETENYTSGQTNRTTRVDHSKSNFNGRSKNDSTEMNSGVAGEQGGGAGVGDGGSINEASGK